MGEGRKGRYRCRPTYSHLVFPPNIKWLKCKEFLCRSLERQLHFYPPYSRFWGWECFKCAMEFKGFQGSWGAIKITFSVFARTRVDDARMNVKSKNSSRCRIIVCFLPVDSVGHRDVVFFFLFLGWRSRRSGLVRWVWWRQRDQIGKISAHFALSKRRPEV